MPLREFVDSKGVAWRVWNTVPGSGTLVGTAGPSLDEGWLTFEGGGARRRLIPIPRGWEDASVERLELMCRAAEVVPSRTPAHGADELKA